MKGDEPVDRKKLIILLLIGGVFLFYVGRQYVVRPIVAGRAAAAKERAALEKNIREAETSIRLIEQTRRNAADQMVALARDVLTGDYALVPRHNNYQIVAEEGVHRWCEEAGVVLTRFQGGRPESVPTSARRTTPVALRAYRGQVTIACSLADTIRLIKVIEDNNPLAAISRLSISAQPADPECHNVSFSVQWPTWSNEEIEASLKQRVRKYMDIPEKRAS